VSGEPSEADFAQLTVSATSRLAWAVFIDTHSQGWQ